MNNKKHLIIMICIALLITCLGVSKLLGTAVAGTTLAEVISDTLGIPDTADDDTSGPDNETSITDEPDPGLDQESETHEPQDPEEIPALELIDTDSLPILEDDTELPIFKDSGTPATNAPMISVSIPVITTPDGEEIQLINDDLTLEEKSQYLSQGFSIQDIYAANEIAYYYQTDSKAVLEKAQDMIAEQKADRRFDSAEVGAAKINWEAVSKRTKKDEIKKIFDTVKDQHPEAVAEMTKERVPVEIQLTMIMIQDLDQTVIIEDLIKDYEGQGRAALNSKMAQSMKNFQYGKYNQEDNHEEFN